jgi:uncharacterized protein YodC (DUF2158 family)
MNEDKLKPGDVVELQSGGPEMTIDSRLQAAVSYTFKCYWFENSKLLEGSFSEPSLKKIDPNKQRVSC